LKKQVKKLKASNKRYERKEKEMFQTIEQLKPIFEKFKEYQTITTSRIKTNRSQHNGEVES